MMAIRYEHISKSDLNLLQTLAILLEERHVTRAAQRCSISQPAMTRAFHRLRVMFGDDLLIRSGRRYERTARGERLLKEFDSLLPRLEGLLRGGGFDPSHSHDRFRVTMTDYGAIVLLPGLMDRLSRVAPNIMFEQIAWHDRRFEDVESGKADMVLDLGGAPPTLQSETLFPDKMVCLLSSHHPAGGRRMSLTQYLRYPHAVVNILAGQQTIPDRPLGDLALKRRVELLVPSFVPAVLAVARTRMILTLPHKLAKKVSTIAAVRMAGAPVEIKGFKYKMTWHPRLSSDPAHKWLRAQIRAVASAT
jgi:DNA-binding transcriptional LysR family regulator